MKSTVNHKRPVRLTLRLDEDLITSAKTYAKDHGRSVSQLVADYFAQLPAARSPVPTPDGSVTSRLRGALRGVTVDEADYRRHLEEKHR